MPLADRLEAVDEMRFWTDTIPLRYEYTAGLAGEKFLRGLQEGRILASRCSKCGRKYLPPKSYCVDCFVKIGTFVEVGPLGTVASLAESHVGFDGGRRARPVTFAYITFKGTTGGIVHRVSGRGLAVGSTVKPRFRPKSNRSGSLLDIEEFRVSGRKD
jgi:uncharacterized OB-fold protein